MSLKGNNRVEWLHDNGEKIALGIWNKTEDGGVIASFGAEFLLFKTEKNGNLTLVKRKVSGEWLTLSTKDLEMYRPPEATTREKEKEFTMMARVGSIDPKKFLLELETLYKNLAGLKGEFNKLARKHDLQAFQEFELIHREKSEAQK